MSYEPQLTTHTSDPRSRPIHYSQFTHLRSDFERTTLDSGGPLGLIWVSLGLGAFFIALIWLNTLLGIFLTPMFTILTTKLIGSRLVRTKPTDPRNER